MSSSRQKRLMYKGSVADPFPRLVYKYHYNFDWENIKNEVYEHLNIVKNDSNLEDGDATSTVGARYYGPHTWDSFQPFMEWLQGPLIETWERLNYTTGNLNCSPEQSWLNLHKKSGVTLEHAHGYVELVVTCYLKLPKDGGYIEYRDPLDQVKVNTPTKETSSFYEVPAITGDILIFPGWLKHRTQPNMYDEDRIVMTINCI